MNALDLCRDADIPTGVICVVTRTNVSDLVHLFHFFRMNNIDVGFNPIVLNQTSQKQRSLSVSPEEYARGLTDVFDEWFYDEYSIQVNPLWEMLGNLMFNRTRSCTLSGRCHEDFISVGPQGDVYPCGRFDGNQHFWIGNIVSDKLQTIEERKRQLNLQERDLSTCGDCSYRRICNGGCLHDAFVMCGDTRQKSFYCAAYKILYDHISGTLNQLIGERRSPGNYNRTDIKRLSSLNNEVLDNVVKRRNVKQETAWWVDGSHSDHHDRSYNDHTDHRDYSDYKEKGCKG